MARTIAHERKFDPLGAGAAQFAPLRAFAAGRTHRAAINGLTGLGDAGLATIDAVITEVAVAERELALRAEADVASVAAAHPSVPVWTAEGLESALAGDSAAECRLLAMLAYDRAERGERAEEAAWLATRALRGEHLLNDDVRHPALLAAGLVLGLAGRTSAAEKLFGKVMQRAQQMGRGAMFSACCGQRGIERYRRGALAEATEDLQAALAAARGQRWEMMVDDGRAHLLRVQTELGRTDTAERELQAWHATGPLPETTLGNRILIERGRLLLAQGRLAEAVADLDSAGRRLAERADSIKFEWRSPAALAHHHLGEQRVALELAHRDLELARAWGAPRRLGIASATLGLIEGGIGGIGRMREAAEILEGSPARLEHARALVNLGALLRRTGQPGQASSPLRAGLELARRAGAAPLVARAEQEMAARAASPRRRAQTSGPDALTPGEHRVALLAADGLSNPDIARKLFVTRKTVEMHLGNAYRKLQIDSRRKLRSALGHGQLV